MSDLTPEQLHAAVDRAWLLADELARVVVPMVVGLDDPLLARRLREGPRGAHYGHTAFVSPLRFIWGPMTSRRLVSETAELCGRACWLVRLREESGEDGFLVEQLQAFGEAAQRILDECVEAAPERRWAIWNSVAKVGAP